MTVKELIAKCIADHRRFAIMVDSYSYHDGLAYDIDTDPDAVHVLCKYNNSALINVEPTFGDMQTGTGLQEVIIPYDKINAVNCLDVSQTLLDKFENQNPIEFNKWKNGNRVEGVSWDNALSLKGTGYVKPPVDPAIKVKEEGVIL